MTADSDITNGTVRNVQRDDGAPPRTRDTLRSPQCPTREDIILYKDEHVIRQMCAQLIATADRSQNFVGKFLDKIQGILHKAAISFDDFDEDDITEFTIRPVLKFTTGVEAGAEFEVKWDLRNEVDITKAISILLSKLPKQSASQVLWHVEGQDWNTPLSELIYAGKLICVYGAIEIEQSVSEFLLKDGAHGVTILVDQGLNKLQPQPRFLQNRPLFVLGLVDCVQPIKIRAGAIVLSSRAVFSISRAA